MRRIELVKKCSSKMNQPIIQNFLKIEENNILFKKVLEEPNDEESKNALDIAFQKYYKTVRILGYISKLIHFYSIDFDKKLNNYKNKIHSDLNSEKDNQQSLDNYFPSKKDLTFSDFLKYESLLEQIENESLYKNIVSLKPTQQRILELIYRCGLNNKEVAKVLRKSEQTVSYNHRTALKKLKNNLER